MNTNTSLNITISLGLTAGTINSIDKAILFSKSLRYDANTIFSDINNRVESNILYQYLENKNIMPQKAKIISRNIFSVASLFLLIGLTLYSIKPLIKKYMDL